MPPEQLSLFGDNQNASFQRTDNSIAVHTGEIWQAGKHLVICGDVLEPEVKRVIKLKQAALLIANPPYGIKAVSKRKGRREGGEEIEDKRVPGFRLSMNSRVHERFPGDESSDIAKKAWLEYQDIGIKQQVWWGANYYGEVLADAKSWLVWDKENAGLSFAEGELAWTSCEGGVRIFHHMWNGFSRASESGVPRVHHTQKPVALYLWLMDRFTTKGDTVIDLFGGSGAALMAGEGSGRRVVTVEIMPHYAAVILQRWQEQTNLLPVKISTFAKPS